MDPVRACPICPKCGSRKFERVHDQNVQVKCVKCGKITNI